MAENKTTRNDADPLEFIAGLDNPQRQDESRELLELFEQRTGEEPVMWGGSIIGFGSYDYQYASGRSGSNSSPAIITMPMALSRSRASSSAPRASSR